MFLPARCRAEGPRQRALHQGLPQAVTEFLGALAQIPLQVAAQPRTVIEHPAEERVAPPAVDQEHARVARTRSERRLLFHHRDQIVGVQLIAPLRMGAILRDDLFRQGGRDRGEPAGVRPDFSPQDPDGILLRPSARYYQRSMGETPKCTHSPLRGCCQA